jgi:hypothetical protein
MPIGDVVAKYETRAKTMLGDMEEMGNSAVWRDNTGRIGLYKYDEAINRANARLQPFQYSLDVAWKMHINQFRDIWTASADLGAERQRTEAMAMAGRLEGENLSGLLKDWLVAADPFRENPDKKAIERRGDALLTGLGRCFEIAKGQGAEFLPDLVAMTQRVRQRMDLIALGERSSSAGSVPHQMYRELSDTITQSRKQTIIDVRETAKKVKDDDAEERWGNCLDLRRNEMDSYYADSPQQFWSAIVREVFKGKPYDGTTWSGAELVGQSEVPSCKDDLGKLFSSRDLSSQLKTLDETIQGPITDDYVLKVRDAAWAVQATIDHYLRGIAAIWSPSTVLQCAARDNLTCTLCLLSDRLLKQVNTIITKQLARQ